jgi:CheY-like chemotaxis protein
VRFCSDDWHVVTAGSGLEALELLLKHEVDLVLLDVKMPAWTVLKSPA